MLLYQITLPLLHGDGLDLELKMKAIRQINSELKPIMLRNFFGVKQHNNTDSRYSFDENQGASSLIWSEYYTGTKSCLLPIEFLKKFREDFLKVIDTLILEQKRPKVEHYLIKDLEERARDYANDERIIFKHKEANFCQLLNKISRMLSMLNTSIPNTEIKLNFGVEGKGEESISLPVIKFLPIAPLEQATLKKNKTIEIVEGTMEEKDILRLRNSGKKIKIINATTEQHDELERKSKYEDSCRLKVAQIINITRAEEVGTDNYVLIDILESPEENTQLIMRDLGSYELNRRQGENINEQGDLTQVKQ